MEFPTAYIGPVGSLVPFLGPSEQTNSDDRPVSFVDTLGGRKAFLGRPGRREWDCSLDARYPGELSGLMWLASYGKPPFVWYPADAIFGNILPPDQAALAPGTHQGLEGPLVEVEPGVHVKSVFSDEFDHPGMQRRDGGAYDPAPVPEGATITVAAWMRGSTLSGRQLLRVQWHGHDGGHVSREDLEFSVSDDWVRRSGTLVVPMGAVEVRLVPHAFQVAGPTVTLTDKLMPYSPGKGAKRVVAHGLSESLILVTKEKSISSASFTVSEVG